MSQEKVLRTLENFGLARLEAQVYVFLGKRGPNKGKDLSSALKIPKQRLYLILKNLQSRGIVDATLEHPAKFSAIPFAKAIDLFIKAKMEEAQRIEGGKDEILSDWKSIALTEAADQSPKFTVIEGRNYIYPRLTQMITDTKNETLIVSTVPSFARADRWGLTDAVLNQISKTGAKFRFLTDLSHENLNAMKLLLGRIPKDSSFEIRTPELGVRMNSRMLIRDNAEAAFYVSKEGVRNTPDADDLCLWTNSNTIVDSFRDVFEDMWQNSISIETRISEIETGKPTAKTQVIRDPTAARKKYTDLIEAAQESVVILTSAEGLEVISGSLSKVIELGKKKNLDIRIMAPITRENLQTALKLAENCKVRHVPMSYLGTAIIDGKQILQFKNPKAKEDAYIFENTIYTDDIEYVDRIRCMLDEFWEKALPPSPLTVEDITKPRMPIIALVPDNEYSVSKKDSPHQKSVVSIEEEPGTITEEYVLNKMINAKRIPIKDPLKDTGLYYGTSAHAYIRPPSNFNLPDMLLSFYHNNKQSAYGAEDWFQVYLWLDTPKGKAYVPVAIAGDTPEAMEMHRLGFKNTPAFENCQVLRKDELQIQIHGNTLFAGWTVPIQLIPPQYILPPASVLVEGYGKLKSSTVRMTMPSGFRVITEGNGFDAFVTFFHPASKYAGSGTDALFIRDFINNVTPPTT